MDGNEQERWSRRIESALTELKTVPLSIVLDCPPNTDASEDPQTSRSPSSPTPRRRRAR
jgi:hypothetical protein